MCFRNIWIEHIFERKKEKFIQQYIQYDKVTEIKTVTPILKNVALKRHIFSMCRGVTGRPDAGLPYMPRVEEHYSAVFCTK
jgi:hypothetical protein